MCAVDEVLRAPHENHGAESEVGDEDEPALVERLEESSHEESDEERNLEPNAPPLPLILLPAGHVGKGHSGTGGHACTAKDLVSRAILSPVPISGTQHNKMHDINEKGSRTLGRAGLLRRPNAPECHHPRPEGQKNDNQTHGMNLKLLLAGWQGRESLQ